jgi:RNA polymerase sigma-70 factor (ECF subfamily)
MVYAMAFVILRRHDDAEDACQDVFVQALKKIDELHNPPKFSGWLKMIARNTAINKKRSKMREIGGIDGSIQDRGESKPPITRVLDEEERGQVRQALRRLNEQDQEIVVAFYFDGYSLPEISCQLQKPLGTIKRRLHDARHRLEKELRLMGFGKDEQMRSPHGVRKRADLKCPVAFLLPKVTSSFWTEELSL